MLMLSTDSVTSIFVFKSVNTGHLPNVFPEIAQRAKGKTLLFHFLLQSLDRGDPCYRT